MDNILSKKIDSLPPLPKTVIDLEEYKRSGCKGSEELLEIIAQDALIVATLLKVSNSAMFGFRSSIETPGRAINLLGINFTISIALGSSIQNLINTNLSAYGISSDDFMRISNLASNLISNWLKSDFDLKEELVLPAFLQETGKFIVSDMVTENHQEVEFLSKVKNSDDISEVEKEYLNGESTSTITASIFEKWNLNENLVNSIKYVDNLDDAPTRFLKHNQILHVVKTICNIIDPFSEANIALGISKAKEFELDVKALEKAVEVISDRLLEE
jgi:HD-like signal output (HDOD) protein